ncbi:MAG TPA: DUF4438 domain-containing protein [Thermomicrobiaceae bacterium]|nr:DUF4438 domain-containing protein [Thermomicrobiaceae bacterium]
MVRTNRDQLVEMAVWGEAWPAALRSPYRPNDRGEAGVLMGTAGVILNVRVGDPAYGWAGDHVEPGVSIRNREDGPEHALHYLACIGNDAVVVSGEAAGARGVMTGEHAHIMVDFEPDVLEQIAIGDRIQIRAVGMGLEMLDYPHISVRKMSPRLFDKLRIEELGDGRIRLPVAAVLPAYMMGSGAELGADYVDQDMISNDRETLAALGLDNLRIGDILAIQDHDHTYNRGYREGAVTIGLNNHGDSFMTGHGPGVMDLLSCATDKIEYYVDTQQRPNLAAYLGIGNKSLA